MPARDGVQIWQIPPGAVGDGREQAERVGVENPFPMRLVRNDLETNVHHRTKQVVVGTAATLILPADPNRRRAIITMITGAQIVYLGVKTPTITSTTGEYFTAVAGVKETIYTQDEVWGIAASAQQTVSVWEEYLG